MGQNTKPRAKEAAVGRLRYKVPLKKPGITGEQLDSDVQTSNCRKKQHTQPLG